MSSKRKHLALVVACCLAVSTVLPGFSYAASTPEETLPVESTAAPSESLEPAESTISLEVLKSSNSIEKYPPRKLK